MKQSISFADGISLLDIPLLNAASNDGLQSLGTLIRPQGRDIAVALDVLGPGHEQKDQTQDAQAHNPMPDSVRWAGFFSVLIGFQVFLGINLVNRLGG
jgi:hypothetical protein